MFNGQFQLTYWHESLSYPLNLIYPVSWCHFETQQNSTNSAKYVKYLSNLDMKASYPECCYRAHVGDMDNSLSWPSRLKPVL